MTMGLWNGVNDSDRFVFVWVQAYQTHGSTLPLTLLEPNKWLVLNVSSVNSTNVWERKFVQPHHLTSSAAKHKFPLLSY